MVVLLDLRRSLSPVGAGPPLLRGPRLALRARRTFLPVSPCVPSPATSLTSAPPVGALFPGGPSAEPTHIEALQVGPSGAWLAPGLRGRGPGAAQPLPWAAWQGSRGAVHR